MPSADPATPYTVTPTARVPDSPDSCGLGQRVPGRPLPTAFPVSPPWMLLGSLCPEFPGNVAGKRVFVTPHTQQPLLSTILHLLGKETQVLACDLLEPGN